MIDRKRNNVNRVLKERCILNNFIFIDNKNICLEDIDDVDRVHLHESGSVKLANNVLDALNNSCWQFEHPSSVSIPIPTAIQNAGIQNDVSVQNNVSIQNNVSVQNDVSSNCEGELSSDISVQLRSYRVRNVGKLIFATLNINSIRNKFEELKSLIVGNIDVLIVTETKLDDSFPSPQFFIQGYSAPYRLDRNKRGGGILIYVREDISSKQLTKHTFNHDIEGIFLELNLNKYKLLIFGTYHPPTQEKQYYLNNISNSLDLYLRDYDRFMLIGDFNISESEPCLCHNMIKKILLRNLHVLKV